MEITELRYFLAVAQKQNLHRAAEKIHISPGSLSKAVARLEDELGLKLFKREGRNIFITEAGRLLEKRASEILQLEESSKVEIVGAPAKVHVILTGAEVLLSNVGLALVEKIKSAYPNATLELRAHPDKIAIQEIVRGDAHLAIVTHNPPPTVRFKAVAESTFQTAVGPGHPLHKTARAGRPVDIDQVLEHEFVVPNDLLLGKVGQRQSPDGWRDDKFPRRVGYRVSSLKLIEELVSAGKAMAYLPDYLVAKLGLEVVRVQGCPYACKQTIKAVTRPSRNVDWLTKLL
jgi:DNA-binding transcriptional LysR family regulator